MEAYIDYLLNIEDSNGMEIEYEQKEYEASFPKYLERIHKISLPKFYTPRYNSSGQIVNIYNSKELKLNQFFDEDYISDVLKEIKTSDTEFKVFEASLMPALANNIHVNKTTINQWIGHSILIIYIKKDDQFYIIDSNGAASIYTYYGEAKRSFFGNPIEIKESLILQRLEEKIENFESEIGGYCTAWAYLYAVLFVYSDKKDNGTIIDIASLILTKCENNPIKLRKLIRNFTYEANCC